MAMSKELHEQQIKEYITKKSNRIFSNSNRQLYQLLLKHVFLNAQSINWILTSPQKLKSFFEDQIFQNLETYVKSGKKLNLILVGNFEFILDDLKELSEENQNFKIKNIQKHTNLQNILTWDNIGYRFAPESHRLTGVVCANDPEFTQKCNKLFNKVFNEI